MRNSKMLRLFLITLLTCCLLFSTGAAWAADNGGGIQPRTITSCIKYFVADSATQATADVTSNSSGFAEYITSTITLQSAPLGSTKYTNVSGVPADVKTVYDKAYIRHICEFPITTTKDYRIKIEVEDCVNGVEMVAIFYHYLDR